MKPYPLYSNTPFSTIRELIDLNAEKYRDASAYSWQVKDKQITKRTYLQTQQDNAFLKRIMSIKELGMIPDYLVNFGVEFTPVDEAAKAVMTIARHFSTEKTVFHICNTGTVPFSRLAEDFSSLGCKIDIVSEKDFTEALHRAAGQGETKHIYENFVSDMDEHDILQYNSIARMDHDFTAHYLKQLGFIWKETDRNYLRKYLEYFQKIGYHMDE